MAMESSIAKSRPRIFDGERKEKTSSCAKGMATLSYRLAIRKATKETIAQRGAPSRPPTYAEIVTNSVHPRLSQDRISTAEPNIPKKPTQLPTHQARAFNAETFITTPNQLLTEDNEEGWIKVTRRKTAAPKKESKTAPKLNKYVALLKAQGRCFRCLDHGHTQFQCRNSVKCHKCHGSGHVSRLCTTKLHPPTNIPAATP
ncbi:hypothetical protein FCM35_KLT19326 [Carex littledalei]|uniref:CCHC-type domain-containing protein n=1 Tax=Carex littledalei TaxID=544730 RepID=A0A833QWD5_9POAL|nr:hypothetical protein FCM35_KLT19326 [Carex littledalei]